MDSTFSLAVHALVYLNHKKCLLSSEALAENICTNPVRVRRVMSKLKNSGFVKTKEGNLGGYIFCGDADTLTLSEIACALQVHFADASWRSGDVDMECLISSNMADVMDEIYLDLDARCKEVLSTITLSDIDKRIFGQINTDSTDISNT